MIKMRLINYRSVLSETLLGKKVKLLNWCSLITILLLFNSCNVIGNMTRLQNKEVDVKKFIPSKKDSLFIQSISVINRLSYRQPFRNFERAGVCDTFNNFEIILKSINELVNTTNYKIKFISNRIVNDSIYKNLLLEKDFINGYDSKRLLNLDFADRQDGIFIIVTIVNENNEPTAGWSGSENYSMNFIYDFFNTKNGKLIEYSSIFRHRILWFYNNPKNRWKPIPRDTRRVFKKLYKQKV
jgi:hypothetical protein